LGEGDLEITDKTGFIWAIRILQQLSHSLSNTIKSWEDFQRGELKYFFKPNTDNLREDSWLQYLKNIERDVKVLRKLHNELQNHTKLFADVTNTVS
jgi:hypothetical protein